MERKLANRGERSEPSGKVEVIIQPPLLNPAVASYFRPASPNNTTDGVWRTLPEIPSSEEIRSSGREPGAQLLQPNVRYGAYSNKETYLASQYAFLREEAVRPLREAVSNIKNIPTAEEDTFSKGSIGIYENVKIVSWLASTRGIAIRVTFSTRRVGKKIQWQQAKRLMTGSLVALTPSNDMFQSKIVIATIAARPLDGLEQNPPELDLFFARTAELEINPALTWVMVEARSSFFEAERHTMLAIQKLASEPFPLSRHIVSVNTNIAPPGSVLSSPQKDMTAVFGNDPKHQKVDVLTSWPTSTTIDLDGSQQQAVQRIFTKALSIIQGPPGTGKTFVSVKAVRALLANVTHNDAPIIVTAQTNHALDQILRHIAEFEPSFARLGGRSQDKDVVLARTLYNLRQSMQGQRRLPGSCATRAKNEMDRLEKLMRDLLEPLAISNDALETRVLLKHDILTAKQVKALEDGAAKWHQADLNTSASPRVFKLWAKSSMIEVAYKPQHGDFGFTYEEEELEFEDLQDIEAENAIKDDDFVDSLKGNRYSLADNFTCRAVPGSKEAAAKKLLDKTDDLWTLPEGQRGPIYRYLQNQLKQVLARKFRELVERYSAASREFRVGQFERDEVILRAQRVVGCTVTGLSKYRGLLAALSPKIVLIEEAAEVLEAPVLAACFPTLDQLILVGDHQQLRPHCRVQDHQDEPLQYNISLFERLLDNGLGITTLTKQRRMIPEVRRLLRPIYGDLIVDHDYVKDKRNRPDIEGMKIKSFFFHHEYPEGRDDLSSCFNEGEAALIVGLANHLVLNGIDSQHITMLTFYNGRRKKLLKLMRQYPSLKGRACPVVTVDSYQGEENKVVLLSCVRSNTIGFLSNINRLCVALSRAQQGFYIFGNVELLHKNKTWRHLFKIISGRDIANPEEIPDPGHHPRRLLYEGFPINCANHDNEVWIKEPTDWTDLAGGCREPCEYVHDCGHVCMLNCHPSDHDLAGCSVACEKTLGCGHVCSMVCGQACVCLTCAKPERTTARLRDARGSSVGSEESADWHEYAKQEHARSTAGQQTPPGARSSPAKKTGSPLKEQLLIEI